MRNFKLLISGVVLVSAIWILQSCGAGKCTTELNNEKQACSKVADAQAKEACLKAATEKYALCKNPAKDKKSESAGDSKTKDSGGYGGSSKSGGYK
jgi:hypothetical protein